MSERFQVQTYLFGAVIDRYGEIVVGGGEVALEFRFFRIPAYQILLDLDAWPYASRAWARSCSFIRSWFARLP